MPRAHVLDEPDLEDLRDVAEQASLVGGEVVANRFGRAAVGGERKGAGDYVTSVDRESEEAVPAFLTSATPEIPVVAEESGGRMAELYWAVDPLDGTTNFLLGFPVVAVSVAVISGRRPVAGAVRAPILDLTFSAARGRGAWSGDERLEVSRREPGRAIVATAYPLRHKELLERYLSALRRVIDGAEDIRRAGAASLDLAWTAAGVFDGYFELRLSVWDVAAGGLLVEEAGGVVTDWDGGPDYLAGDVLAGSPATHALLREAAGAA